MDALVNILPFIGIPWLLLIISVLLAPQRFRNCFLLMFALMMSALGICYLLGDIGSWALLIIFVLFVLFMLVTPIVLCINGIIMIRNEGLAFSNILSLLLGICIFIGEVCFIYGVLASTQVLPFNYFFVEALFVGVSAFYASMIMLSFIVYSIFILYVPHRMKFDYIIIHGCGLIDGYKVSKLLSNRIDKAIKMYDKCKIKPVLVPSGGKGSDETLAEAEAMADYLREKGIPEEHILLENRSRNTFENLVFSKNLIEERGGSRKVALVSSNYHVYRCLVYARQLHFHCVGVGAKVALYYFPCAIIREFIAVFKNTKNIIVGLLGWLILVSPFLIEMLSK